MRNLRLRSVVLLSSVALVGTATLVVAPAGAAPGDPPEVGLEVYTGLVDPADVETLRGLGLDAEHFIVDEQAEGGKVEVEVAITDQVATKLQKAGVEIDVKRVHGNKASEVLAEQAQQGWDAFRQYGAPGGIKDEILAAAAEHSDIAKVVNVGVRDSTYVLDGLLYHESDLRIEEHYTDTAGFTDHVFALMHLLGFRFAPRLRDLGDTKLYIFKRDTGYDALKPTIGGLLNIKHIRAHWDEILRLATSIKQGTVTASLMLRKLGSYPRQNGLAVALRELGRIERTLFILDWLQSVELRRRVHAGLNKGEARNALARAVFFSRLGDIRDRSFENQRYRASGLNLVTAAIVLWNTVYLERATNAVRGQGQSVDDVLLQNLSPLGWEHVNLTGDYLWRRSAKIGAGKFRPLRPLPTA